MKERKQRRRGVGLIVPVVNRQGSASITLPRILAELMKLHGAWVEVDPHPDEDVVVLKVLRELPDELANAVAADRAARRGAGEAEHGA